MLWLAQDENVRAETKKAPEVRGFFLEGGGDGVTLISLL